MQPRPHAAGSEAGRDQASFTLTSVIAYSAYDYQLGSVAGAPVDNPGLRGSLFRLFSNSKIVMAHESTRSGLRPRSVGA